MRRDKLREEEYLQSLLTRLTEEMKEKYQHGDPLQEEVPFPGTTMSQNFYFDAEGDDNQLPPVRRKAHLKPSPKRQQSPEKISWKVSPSRAKIIEEMSSMSKFDLQKMFPTKVNKTPEKVATKTGGKLKVSPTRKVSLTSPTRSNVHLSPQRTSKSSPHKRMTSSVSPSRHFEKPSSSSPPKKSPSPNRRLALFSEKTAKKFGLEMSTNVVDYDTHEKPKCKSSDDVRKSDRGEIFLPLYDCFPNY